MKQKIITFFYLLKKKIPVGQGEPSKHWKSITCSDSNKLFERPFITVNPLFLFPYGIPPENMVSGSSL